MIHEMSWIGGMGERPHMRIRQCAIGGVQRARPVGRMPVMAMRKLRRSIGVYRRAHGVAAVAPMHVREIVVHGAEIMVRDAQIVVRRVETRREMTVRRAEMRREVWMGKMRRGNMRGEMRRGKVCRVEMHRTASSTSTATWSMPTSRPPELCRKCRSSARANCQRDCTNRNRKPFPPNLLH
ncbi:MAG TPA: hypothetical protein VL048_18695 [Xanthobacteraceae bacterium]|nr:hypothetical protein [Xanthobacteraceae bacterium]